jgi:hypothetical protein
MYYHQLVPYVRYNKYVHGTDNFKFHNYECLLCIGCLPSVEGRQPINFYTRKNHSPHTGNTQDSNAKPRIRNYNTLIITHWHTNLDFRITKNLLNKVQHITLLRDMLSCWENRMHKWTYIISIRKQCYKAI